jgi:hypothetical protein
VKPRGARRDQQQDNLGLEGAEHKTAGARPRYLRGQGAFADRQPDAEPYGEGGETQSQGTDDEESSEEGQASEALPTLVVKLTELSYRRGRRLDPRRERHRYREG